MLLRLLFFYFLVANFTAFAQGDTIILNPTKATLRDTVSINFYLQASRQYAASNNFENSLSYGVKGLELAMYLGYEKGILDSWQLLGKTSAVMGKYELALDYQHQALEAHEKNKNNAGMVACMNDLADIYTKMKEYEQAMEYKFQALELEEDFKDDKAIAQSYTQMAALYSALGNHELAFNYCSKAIKNREKQNDRRGLADTYKVLGLAHAKIKSYRPALEYLRKSLSIKDTIKNATDVGEILNNIGDVYNTEGNPQQAKIFYQQAYDKEQSLGNKKGITNSLINLGKNAIDLKDFASAADYLKKALAFAQKIDSKEDIDMCYLYLSKIYEKSKNVTEALKYYKLYTDYQKQIFDENSDKKIAEMHEIIETNQREKEIAILNKDKEVQELQLKEASTSTYILMIMVGFVILLFLAALIFLRTLNEKNKQLAERNNLISQKSLLMEELNSTKNKFFSIIAHDLKSPLNSLSGFSNLIINHIEYLSKDEIKMMAVDLDKSIRNLYDLLNNLLTWARSQMNTIEFQPKNLDVAEIFADLVGLIQLNANNKKIHLVTHTTPDIKVFADENALKTVLRNLASNALKFTLEDGKVTLAAKPYDDKFVQISINDTGVGMDAATIAKLFRIDSKHSTKGTQGESGTGLGLLLCKEFVEKNGGSISVESILEVGTTFKVLLPIEKPLA
jgi:signal transduction histidine kinase/Tfp pilus assembly protein PilF